MKYVVRSALTIGLLSGCSILSGDKYRSVKDFSAMQKTHITSLKDAMAIFPRSVSEIEHALQAGLDGAKIEHAKLLAIAPQDRTFENTMRALDRFEWVMLSEPASVFQLVGMTYPDAALQEAAKKAEMAIKKAQDELIASNKAVYHAVQSYVDNGYKTENLTATQRYYVEEALKFYKRRGMHLSDAELARVSCLYNEIEELVTTFDTNLANDKRTVLVKAEGLAGVSPVFIATLEKNADDAYILKCDYPTAAEVPVHCSVEDTRRRYTEAFGNRGMPENLSVLDGIIAKRDQYAKALGFESYAAYELSGEMVETPARATAFLEQVVAKASKKAAIEAATLKAELPAGIALDAQGKFNSWDLGYVETLYKKKHFNIDQRVIAEYFSVDKALEGVFDIYQKFLSLRFKMVKPEWSWHEDVTVIEVFDAKTDLLRGYIILDLHPRQGKYTHACCAGLRYPVLSADAAAFGGHVPAVAAVIANFPKATKDTPALLKPSDVVTFFHEFGHAMHFFLGTTELYTHAGYNTKIDFVEMPSQMFEEWLFDRELLKNVSSHYKTGEHLPDAFIDALINLKRFNSGGSILVQARYAFMSLLYFAPGEVKDTEGIRLALNDRLLPHIARNTAVRPQASFAHLGHYGARYYGYLWSKVFALDLFDHIKPHGLMNPENGTAFIDAILGRGGSCDPNAMLKNFLGREPRVDAFFKDQGFE